MVEHFTRPLTSSERDELTARLRFLRRLRRSTPWKSAAASVIVCALLGVATLLASDAPRPVILAFWTLVALVLAAWVTRSARVDTAAQEAVLQDALAHSTARVTRVQSASVVTFEEIDDEGECYAFDIGDNQILFVMGQEFYDLDGFPTTDFSIVEPLASSGQPIDQLIRSEGYVLTPVRAIAADVKERLEIPDHLAVVRGRLEDLEALLSPGE